jgi:hypothetical protein
MWPSFELALLVYNAANWLLISALVGGVIATFLVVWMGNVKDEYLRLDIANSYAKAEEAKAASAEANARAAEANKIAEDERLARAKLEERLAPRSLTQQQVAGLSGRLAQFAGATVDILQVGESPEINHFRALIQKALHDAGIHVVPSTAVGSGYFIGISVALVEGATDSEKDTAVALLLALNAEGIVATDGGLAKRDAWPGFVMVPPGESANKAPIRLYIGSKP